MRAEEAYALDGARKAAARLDAAIYRNDIAHAAAEAASWLGALDERIGGKDPQSPYVSACKTAGTRDLMQGLRYIRNQAIHSLAILSEDTGGIVTSLPAGLGGGPVRIWQGKWAPEGESRAQYTAFQRELAGRDVAKTIRTAIAWLEDYLK